MEKKTNCRNLNKAYSGGYRDKISKMAGIVRQVKNQIETTGLDVMLSEPLKIVIRPKTYGYTGSELGEILYKERIAYEYADPDFLVLMASPENTFSQFRELLAALKGLSKKEKLQGPEFSFSCPEKICSIRKASMSPFETIPVKEGKGRIAALSLVSCPPAIAVVVPGERINENIMEICSYYGIHKLNVMKE